MQTLAKHRHLIKLLTLHLFDDDMKVLLKAAEPRSKGGTQNFATWGVLAPRDVVSRYATGGIVNWAMQCVGLYSTVPEVGSCLQQKCMFVNSYVMEAELKRFETNEPHVPLSKEMKSMNLLALKQRIFSKGYTTLDTVPGLEVAAFILNSKSSNHWSLALFDCRNRKFVHFDSADNIHELLAIKAYRLLVTVGLIPEGTEIARPQSAPQQVGGWECGYAMLATAFYYSRKLKTLIPEVDEPREVICNPDMLQRFISQLVVRATAALKTEEYHRLRLERIHRDK